MPGIFEEVKFKWKGREYAIPADRIMMAIATVEDVITLTELYNARARMTPPLGKIAIAFARVLRYAGAPVQDDEVYGAMFGEGEDKILALRAVETLLLLMMPPDSYRAVSEVPPKGKGESRDSGSKSSRKRTK